MDYKLKNHVQEKVGAEVKREIVTVEVTYEATEIFLDENGEQQTRNKTSQHNFVLQEGETIKEAAIRGAAELSKILAEPVDVVEEEVEVAEADKVIKTADIQAKLAVVNAPEEPVNE